MKVDESTSESVNADAKPAIPAAVLKIVVVDDDTAWLADLEMWLTHEGFR